MAKRKKIAHQAGADSTKPSPFLELPAELRNNIYELVASDKKKLYLRKGRVFYAPPLSLVCKQIRQEYRNIYIQRVLEQGVEVSIHVTDFKATRNELRSPRQALVTDFTNVTNIPISRSVHTPKLSADVTTYLHLIRSDLAPEDRWLDGATIILTLTNNFDNYLHKMREMLVRVNPRSFDFDFCKYGFSRLRDASQKLEDAVGKMLKENKAAKELSRGEQKEAAVSDLGKRKRVEVEDVE